MNKNLFLITIYFKIKGPVLVLTVYDLIENHARQLERQQNNKWRDWIQNRCLIKAEYLYLETENREGDEVII